MSLPSFEYLIKERGLTQKSIEDFILGYCDDEGKVYMKCGVRDFPPLDYRFTNSTLFPICNLYNKVVGVSSRPLAPNNKFKYVNTVYPKASHLYGLNVSWKDCLSKDAVYIVEGNVDTIMMRQYGIPNVVGLLGSNFSTTQFCLLLRFAKELIFVPDGDVAGLNFLSKVREALPKKFHDIDVKWSYIQLPTGEDPDAFLRANGSYNFLQLPKEGI